MNFGEPFWLKRTHTVLLSGHGGALVMLTTALSTEGSIDGIRENLWLFIPFLAGLVCLLWTGFRGISLDTYRTSLRTRDELETKLSKTTHEKVTARLQADIDFLDGQISKLGKQIKKRPLSSRMSLWMSSAFFVLGVIAVGMGNKIAEMVEKCI